MKKILSSVLLMAAVLIAAPNTTGLNTASAISTICTTNVVAYSNVYDLSDYEDLRLIVKVNDTSSAAYSSDSVAFQFGYQTGVDILNASGTRDTCWDVRVIIDTMLASEFGTVGEAKAGADGSITRAYAGADTLNVTGFATLSRWLVPEWDGLIRFYVKGLAANNKGSALKLYMEPRQRLQVRTK